MVETIDYAKTNIVSKDTYFAHAYANGKSFEEQGITVVPIQCFDENVVYIEMATSV